MSRVLESILSTYTGLGIAGLVLEIEISKCFIIIGRGSSILHPNNIEVQIYETHWRDTSHKGTLDTYITSKCERHADLKSRYIVHTLSVSPDYIGSVIILILNYKLFPSIRL